MPIPVTCKCGQQFLTRDENAGRRARCPDCGRELTVPGLAPSPIVIEDVGPIKILEPKTSRNAIASLVLGSCFFCVAIAGIPAIIVGFHALNDINQSNGRLKGRRLAIAGIWLGLFSTFLTVALMLPAVRSAREAARRSQCVNNLKQIGLAMHNYHDSYGCFPPAAITDKNGKPLLSWRVAILPFMESSPIYNKFHLDEPWNSPHNLTLLNPTPNYYLCPSDPTLKPGMTAYQVIVDAHSIFRPDFQPVPIADVTDGTSFTILVGESRKAVPWTAPEDLPLDMTVPQSGLDSFHSFHSGGYNALFADGSVKFLKTWIKPEVLKALITRDGGEVIDASSF